MPASFHCDPTWMNIPPPETPVLIVASLAPTLPEPLASKLYFNPLASPFWYRLAMGVTLFCPQRRPWSVAPHSHPLSVPVLCGGRISAPRCVPRPITTKVL